MTKNVSLRTGLIMPNEPVPAIFRGAIFRSHSKLPLARKKQSQLFFIALANS